MASPSAPLLQERSQTADLLKGIAVVLMIQVHLMEQFATLELSSSSAGRLSLFLGGPPAAPVFLSVMGFFLSKSRKTLWQLFQRGILLILGGLLLNVGLNANLLYSIHQGRYQADPLSFVFGADILCVAGLSVIILAFLRRRISGNPMTCVFIAFLVPLISPVLRLLTPTVHPLLLHISAFLWGDIWWSYFPLFPWLAYSLLGYTWGTSPQYLEIFHSMKKWKQVSIVVAVLLILSLFIPYAAKTVTHLSQYYHHDAPLFLWMSGFLVIWTFLVNYLNGITGDFSILRYLKWLGQNVTSAYVFQWLIIGNVATEIYHTQVAWQLIAWFVSIMFFVSLLVVSYRRIRKRFLASSFPSLLLPWLWGAR